MGESDIVEALVGYRQAYRKSLEAVVGVLKGAKDVRQWAQATGRHELLPHWQSMEKASTQFNELLMKTRARLAEEYNSGRSEVAMRVNKKIIFSDMKSEYQVMVNEQWNGRNYFKSWFSSELNNARLALINSYQGGVCAFTKLYESAGRDILQLQPLAAKKEVMCN